MITYSIKNQSDRVVIQFDESTKHLGLLPRQALDLANTLTDKAESINTNRIIPPSRAKHQNEKIPFTIERTSDRIIIEFDEELQWVGLTSLQALQVAGVILSKLEVMH